MEPIVEGSAVDMSPPQNVGNYNSIVGDIVKNRTPAIEQTDTGLASAQQAVTGIIQQRKSNLNSTFASVSGTNPDEAAAAQNIGGQIGVGQDLAMQNMVAVKKAADQKRFESYDLMAKNPVLGRQMMDREFASVAHDDIPQLTSLGGLFKVLGAAATGQPFPLEVATEIAQQFGGSQYQTEEALIYHWMSNNGLEEKDINEETRQRLKMLEENAPPPINTYLFGGVSYAAGQMFSMAPEVSKYAVAGGLTGGALGLAGGPLAPATVAGGVLTGIGLGATAGIGVVTSQIEGGMLYKELLRNKVPKDVARTVSSIGGTVNGLIEIGTLGLATAPFKAALKKVVGETIIKRGIQEISKPTAISAIKTAGKYYGMEVLGEQVQEISQEMTSIVAEDVAGRYAPGEFESKFSTPEGLQELANRVLDVSIQTYKATAVMGAFGPMINLAVDAKNIRDSAKTKQFLTDLSKNVQATKLKGRSPSALANFVAAQAEGTAAETMYVDAEEMVNVLNQSGLTTQQIDNALPGVREQLARATSGGDIQIPTAQFAANVVGTKLEAPLMEHARLAPDAISAKQAIAQQETMQQNMKDAQVEMAVQEVTNAQFVREAKEIEKVVNDQLVAAGRPATEAAFAAKLVQARAVTAAAAAGITPAQWVANHPVPTIQSQQQAMQAAQQAAQQVPAQGSLEQSFKYIKQFLSNPSMASINEENIKRTKLEKRRIQAKKRKAQLNSIENMKVSDLLDKFQKIDRKNLGIEKESNFVENNFRPEIISWAKDKFADLLAPDGSTVWKNFTEWFGDSKVVDAEGKPLIMYHGTDKKFTKINMKKGAQGVFWITSNKESIINGESGALKSDRVMMLFASIKNPAGWDEYNNKSIAELKRDGYDGVILRDKSGAFDAIVFEPTQIKSAIINIGTYSDTDANILRQEAVPATFYSALSVEVGKSTTKSASADSWKQQIKGLIAKGVVKEKEVYWSGLDNWLDLQEGKITKEQVQTFLDASGVKVKIQQKSDDLALKEAVEIGTAQAYLALQDADAISEDIAFAFDELEEINAEGGDDYRRGQLHAIIDVALDEQFGTRIDDYIEGESEGGGLDAPTKYSRYQLPGGTNYREALVTLPNLKAYSLIGDNDKVVETFPDRESALKAMRKYEDSKKYEYPLILRADTSKYAAFVDRHWDELNVLVHFRMNDRVDADGKKVLFVEEVQSGWGQEGREKGFSTGQSLEEINVLAKPYLERFYSGKGDMSDVEWTALSAKVAELEKLHNETADRSRIPAAPFVETTSGWLELGLKQILLEAVNGGYDRVAFVDGDQSVQRYRKALTEAVDEVEITRNDDGTYTYSAIKGGNPVQGEQSVSANRINEVFGKAGSKQLLEEADAKPDEIHTIASSDIEIGGEGMRKFYDTIVPQALGKMLKKLSGDKIENVNMITEKPVTQEQINAAEKRKDFTEAERLTAIYERQQLGRGVSKKGQQQIGEQQGFTVTPALAEQVSQGLPLFQAATGGTRGEYDPIKNLIGIGKNADYSTVAHELAHWYVVDLFRTASDPTASEASRADADILLNWFGIAGDNVDQRLANWNAMTLDEQRKHHEAVAYNWELYLHTGKAPSVELQGVFDRFRRWLTRAYKSIRDDLNEIYRNQFGTDLPFLTDEVRGVFDRMLASEEQIARREAIDNFKGMYQTQEESGMNDATWAAYQAEIAEAHEMAVTDLTKATVKQMEWLSGARKGILKSMQAAHNALRRSVQGEESNKMDNEPVRKAERFFKTGKMVDPSGKEIEVLVGNKIDSVAVEGMYPTSTTGLAPAVDLTKLRGMTMEGGLAPDLAAEMFGFSSGDELIRALAELKPFKDELKERTDARMLDEHGGMNTEAEKEEAVNKALANEVRARIVAIENRYLTKVKTPVAVIMQGAKELARTILGRMAIKDIKPRNYVAAEARVAKDKHTAVKAMQSPETAGKSAYTRSFNEQIAAGVEESVAASEALVKSVEAIKRAQAKIDARKKQYGDVDPAIVAKKASHQQVIQGQLAKEGYKILDEVEKQVSLFKRFFKDDKKIAATRNMDLVNAARSILAFYGLGKHDKLPGAYLKQIQEYNPGLFETISAMVNEAQVGTPDYRLLTFEEFQSMQETVDALWQLAKRENQIKIEGKMVSLGQATEKLEKRLDVIGVPTTIAGETQAVTSKDRAVRHINSMKAILRRVEHWADSTDGAGNVGGPFTKYIWRPISQALDAYRIDRNNYVKRYVELLKQVSLPAGKIAAPELNYTFGAGNGGIGIAELLGAIMHSGNISNLEKLLIGRKWATVSEDGTMDTSRWDKFVARVSSDGTLTKEHFDFIQAVWDLNEELKPMVQKAHYDIEGYYFKEVEATPFTNRFGTYRGGYVPAKTDPFIVRDAQRQAKMSELESDFRAAMPSTGAGFTKSRVKYNKALSLDIRLMAKHIDDVIRYSHVQPAVKDVLRILKKSSFADKLTQMDAMAIDDMLTPWLNRAARQITNESGRVKAFDTFWRTVRSRTGISVMIGNITNALQQVTGLFMSAIKVSPAHLGNALYAYVASPNKSAQEVCELSPFMKNKMENQIFDLQDQMNELLLNPNKFEKIQKWSSHHGYFLQSAFQNMVDVVTWTGAYNQYLEESGVGMSDFEAQREAVNRADAAVRLTQGTMNPEGIAAFEVGTPFYKTFIQFTGYFNMLANLNTDEYVKIFRDLGWRGNKGKLVSTFILGFAAQAIISDAIVRTMRGGWEDDDNDGYLDVFMDWIFGSMARSAVAMVPFGSTAMTALSQIVMPVIKGKAGTGYDDRIQSSPSISALTSSTVGVGRAILDVVSEGKEVTGQDVKDVMTLISLSTGVPVTILGRPVSYLVDVNRGKVEPTSTVDLMRGLITGTATKESKKR